MNPMSEVLRSAALRGLIRLLAGLLLLASATVQAQSAIAQQFMNLNPAEREQMMRQFGLSPDDVLGAIRQGAGSMGSRSPSAGSAGSRASGQGGGAPGGDSFSTDGQSMPSVPIVIEPHERYEADLVAPVDYGERYGLEVFTGAAHNIQEVYSTPVPDDYVLASGDVLIVSFYGTESGQYYTPVMRNGAIELSGLGPVQVAGLPFREAREVIASRVANEKIGVNASVTVDRLKSIQLAVSGEVERPGVYVLPALVSLTQVLSVVGGPTELGALRRVAILRGGERIEVDLYATILGGDRSALVSLQPGDAIHVPAVGAAAGVGGAVRRPGVYEVLPGETVSDLVAMAGGLRPGAVPGEGVLRRYDDRGRLAYSDVDLSGGSDVAVGDGMVLRIPSASDYSRDMVELRGEVTSPGIREWRPDLMLSDLIGDVDRSLRVQRVDLDYGYVVRTDPETHRIRFLDFVPREIAAGMEDLALEPRDVVLVLPLPGVVAEEKLQQAMFDGDVDGSASREETPSDDEYADDVDSARSSDESSRRRSNRVVRNLDTQALLGAAGLPQGAASLGGFGAPPAVIRVEQPPEPEPVRDRQDLLAPHLGVLRAQTRDGSRVPQFMIAGEVHAPGTYPITDSGRMADALRAAGGLLETADQTRAVVLRKADVDAPLEVFEVPMRDLANPAADRRIQPGDVITIGRDPSLANRLEVQISGEVASPGSYTLPTGSTLSDLIEIAGGVTPRADLRSAIFSRARLREMEDQLRQRYIAEIRKNLIDAEVAGDQDAADPAVIELLDELQSALDQQSDGRLQIDLPRLAAGDRSAEVFLSSGDRLTIPSQTNAVSVAGQVRAPGSFGYVKGMTADAYLELAGGLSSYSDEDEIFVVRADGSVQSLGRRSFFNFNRSDVVLYPGDRVVVPIDTDYINAYNLAKDLIQFTYQTGIGLAAVVAAFR
jgi:protein involved in polysaccharide export with SLBB domain